MLLLEEQRAERRRAGQRRAAAASAVKGPTDFRRQLQTSEAMRLQRLQAAEAKEERRHEAFRAAAELELPRAPAATAASSLKIAPPQDVGAPEEGAAASNKRRGNPNDGAPKKKPLLPNDVKEYLTKWCLENIDSPYPNEREKYDICASTHLTLTQVNNWCVPAMLGPKPARSTDLSRMIL